MPDRYQTSNQARFITRLGWRVVQLPSIVDDIKIRAYWRYFPGTNLTMLKLQRYTVLPDEQVLRQVQKDLRVVVTAFEPDYKIDADSHWQLMQKIGAKITKDFYLPTKTRLFDLHFSMEKLVSGHDSNVKRILSKTSKFPTFCKKATDFTKEENQHFYNLARRYNKHWPLNARQWQHFVDSYSPNLYYCITSDPVTKEWLSGIVLITTSDRASYFCAWTTPAGRKVQVHTKSVWESILFAKSLCLPTYDFEGEFDPRFPRPSWQGYTNFKKKFGGTTQEYPGCYIHWNPWAIIG